MDSIYRDIAARTGGNIYIGVVGPVRTGKSTLVKRIMEELVIPGIADPYRAERARDELPQSGSGRTIMTAEPKFVPEEAVEVSPDGAARMRVRMIDSVGYMIPGAVGAEEDGVPRMVTTPWYDYEIPMTDAAELGTRKVMQEHCSVGIVVTTDGTITDIPRRDYIEAEARAVRDMRATGKPFIVIVNTREPSGEAAQEAAQTIAENLGTEPLVLDCQAPDEGNIQSLFEKLLYAFPMTQLNVGLPRWMDALEQEHPVKSAVYRALLECAGRIGSLAQAGEALTALETVPQLHSYTLRDMDLSSGIVRVELVFPQSLFYELLSARAGRPIKSEGELLTVLTQLSRIEREHAKIADALEAACATGYGVVMPTADEMTLETPQIVRRGSACGVKLRAGAPSIHMLRVDIDTEISPMVGDEKQSQELVQYLQQEDPEKLWQSNIFGKSVYELIQEGLTAKLVQLPEDVRGKFRGTLAKIVNDGANGLICLIL